jgi:lysylphosphatidylglycerol synthetase-like protein (DUF2156 family)
MVLPMLLLIQHPHPPKFHPSYICIKNLFALSWLLFFLYERLPFSDNASARFYLTIERIFSFLSYFFCSTKKILILSLFALLHRTLHHAHHFLRFKTKSEYVIHIDFPLTHQSN